MPVIKSWDQEKILKKNLWNLHRFKEQIRDFAGSRLILESLNRTIRHTSAALRHAETMKSYRANALAYRMKEL